MTRAREYKVEIRINQGEREHIREYAATNKVNVSDILRAAVGLPTVKPIHQEK